MNEITDSLNQLYEFYPSASRVKTRLLDIISDGVLEDGEEPVSLGSIKRFIGFLKTYKPKYPNIVITNYGNVVAEWREHNDKIFTIEFFPDGDCAFLCFKPNSKNPNKVVRFSGLATADTVMDEARDLTGLILNE
jgi:hypothetical protein